MEIALEPYGSWYITMEIILTAWPRVHEHRPRGAFCIFSSWALLIVYLRGLIIVIQSRDLNDQKNKAFNRSTS